MSFAIAHLHIPDDHIPDLPALIRSVKEETADRLAMSPDSVEVFPHRYAAPSHRHGSSFKITVIVEASLTQSQLDRKPTLTKTLAFAIASRNKDWLAIMVAKAPKNVILVRIDNKPEDSWATADLPVVASDADAA